MTSEEAMWAYQAAKANLKTHPETIQRLWEEYCHAVEREMKEKGA